MDEETMPRRRAAWSLGRLGWAALACIACSSGCGGGGSSGTGSLPATAAPSATPPVPLPNGGVPVAVAFLAQASAPNAFAGSIAAGAQHGLIAVLSTALAPSGSLAAPASENVNVSIGPSASSAMLQRGSVQTLAVHKHVWAAEIFGLHAAGQSPANPARSEAHPDERYLATLTALARNAGRSPAPLERSRTSQALSNTVGASAPFWVSNAGIGTSTDSYVSVPATLRASSAHANVWIDATLSFDAPSLQQIGADFETAYASDTGHFGTAEYSAAAPGARLTAPACDASGNALPGGAVPLLIPPPGGRHVVLIVNQNTMGSGMGGYFSGLNFLPQAVANCLSGRPKSNETSMIVLGYAPGADLDYALKEDFVRGTAHEFQHDINFVQHFVLAPAALTEETWLNEGLSMLAQDFAVSQVYGGSPGIDVDDALGHAQQFLSAPEAYSLTAFSGPAGASAFAYNCSGCYGDSYLFMRYLYDRFGGDAFTRAMESGGAVGASNLGAATGTAPNVLIGDYGVALAAGGLGISADPRFNFKAFDPYGSYTDQFGRAVTLNGPAAIAQTPGSSVTYATFSGTFQYFATQPAVGQGAGVLVTDAGGGLLLTPALIQH